MDDVVHEFPLPPARVQAIHPGSYVHVERGFDGDARFDPLTVECWVRPFRTDVLQPIVTWRGEFSSGGFGLFIVDGGRVAFEIGAGNPSVPSTSITDAVRVDAGAPLFAAGGLTRDKVLLFVTHGGHEAASEPLLFSVRDMRYSLRSARFAGSV